MKPKLISIVVNVCRSTTAASTSLIPTSGQYLPRSLRSTLRSGFNRKGLYNINKFPYVLGTEGAGTIVALPSDSSIQNDDEFKKLGLKVGGKIATVSTS